MAYKITATVRVWLQEPAEITMFRDVKVTESAIKKIYKAVSVDNYQCEGVA